MSSFEIGTKGNTVKTVYVLPSQCEWSDIEQFKNHNRGQNEPKEELDELMASIKAREAVVTPLKGYLKGSIVKITSGSRRLAASQALESEGMEIYLPIALIKEPKTKDEIINAMLDAEVDNNVRKGDSDIIRHSTYTILREEGLTLKEIGERTGVSHTLVANTIKVFRVEPLKNLIEKGKLSVRAATEYVGEKYQKTDANNKPVYETLKQNGKNIKQVVYDVDKIRKDLGQAGQAATEAGKSKIGTTTARQTSGESKPPNPELTGMQAVKHILDQPEDDIPTVFRAVFRWLNGNLEGLKSLRNWAEKNKMLDELEWLFDIEFNKQKIAFQKEKEAESKKKKTVDKKTTSEPESKGKGKGKAKKEEEELDADEYE